MTNATGTLAAVSVERCEHLLTELVAIPSVVGDPTPAHLWVTAGCASWASTVRITRSKGRTAPLVLGVLEGDGDGPGVLFDAHFDTVHARPDDWSRDPWGAQVEDGILYGRGAVDSKGTHVAMLAALEVAGWRRAPRAAARSTSCRTPTARTGFAAPC